jgi:hypothetical protein
MDAPEYKEIFQHVFERILKPLVNGKQNKVVSIMLPVLDLQLQVEVQIYLL